MRPAGEDSKTLVYTQLKLLQIDLVRKNLQLLLVKINVSGSYPNPDCGDFI